MYRKFVMFWNFYERPDNLNFYFMKTLAPALNYGITYGILAPLGILGIFLSLRIGGRTASSTFSFLLTWPHAACLQLREVQDTDSPVIMLWAAFALVWLYEKAKVQKWKK